MNIITELLEKLLPVKISKLNHSDLDDINGLKNKYTENTNEIVISKGEEAFHLLESYRKQRNVYLSTLSNPKHQKKSLSRMVEVIDDKNSLNTGEVIMLWWCNGRANKPNQSFPKYFSRMYNINPYKTFNKLQKLQLVDANDIKYSLSTYGKNILNSHLDIINNHKNNIYLSVADNEELNLNRTKANIEFIDKASLLLLSDVDETDPYIHMLFQTIEGLKHSAPHNFICPLQPVDVQLVKHLNDSWQNKIEILNDVSNAESKMARATLYKKISKYPDLSISDIKFKFNISYDTDENHQIFLLSKELTKSKHYEDSNKFILWAMHKGYQRTETWLRLAINYRYLKDLNSEEVALQTGILWCKQCNEDDKKLTERLGRVHELMNKKSV